MPSGVVVDTTVWIEFLRGRNDPVRRHLRTLLSAQRVVLVGIVMAEVLQGIRSPSEHHQVEDHFRALPYLETRRETWRAASELARELREVGQSVPLSDLVIAAIAMEHALSLYSTDPHFVRIPHLVLEEYRG